MKVSTEAAEGKDDFHFAGCRGEVSPCAACIARGRTVDCTCEPGTGVWCADCNSRLPKEPAPPETQLGDGKGWRLRVDMDAVARARLAEAVAKREGKQLCGPVLPCWYCEGRDGDGEAYNPAVHKGWACEACAERQEARARWVEERQLSNRLNNEAEDLLGRAQTAEAGLSRALALIDGTKG